MAQPHTYTYPIEPSANRRTIRAKISTTAGNHEGQPYISLPLDRADQCYQVTSNAHSEYYDGYKYRSVKRNGFISADKIKYAREPQTTSTIITDTDQNQACRHGGSYSYGVPHLPTNHTCCIIKLDVHFLK